MATQTTKKPAAKSKHTKTVDDYLAAAPNDKRAALMKLRKTINAAPPNDARLIAVDPKTACPRPGIPFTTSNP